jgi:hypothetical protein
MVTGNGLHSILKNARDRVSDPYSFDPDPDPAFEAGDQSGSGSNPDPGLK